MDTFPLSQFKQETLGLGEQSRVPYSSMSVTVTKDRGKSAEMSYCDPRQGESNDLINYRFISLQEIGSRPLTFMLF